MIISLFKITLPITDSYIWKHNYNVTTYTRPQTCPTSSQVEAIQLHSPPPLYTHTVVYIVMTKFQFNQLGKVKNQRKLDLVLLKSLGADVTVMQVA